MPEFEYNFSSLYIVLGLFSYNIIISNYEYIRFIINQILLLNSISIVFVINIIGIYLFLRNLHFEIYFKIYYKPLEI
jgi:hypothetical protein